MKFKHKTTGEEITVSRLAMKIVKGEVVSYDKDGLYDLTDYTPIKELTDYSSVFIPKAPTDRYNG